RVLLLEHLWLVVGGLGVLLAFQALCFYFRSSLFAQIGQFVVADLRERLFKAIISREIAFFDQTRPSDLVSRLNSDVQMLQDAVSVKLSVFLRYSLQVIAGLVLMLMISVQLTIAILLGLPIIVGLSLILGKRLRSVSRAQQTELGILAAISEEVFALIRMVKAAGNEASEVGRLADSNRKVAGFGLKRAALAAFFSSFVNFLMCLFLLAIFAYGIILVTKGQLSNGDFTAFTLYGAIVAVSFAFVAGGYAEFVQALGASDRVFELLESESNIRLQAAPAKFSSLSDAGPLAIAFEGVHFNYENRPSNPVLSNLSFSMAPGSFTALVGPSGAGKSTVVNLVLGFYQSYQGLIKLGGIDYRELDLREVRARIAYVPQEPVLFNISIRENLCYGLPNAASLEELRLVCSKLNIINFVDSLPDGFNTLAGERGLQLSGGQRQRLMIARALLRKPKLLVLDEATSALDSENEGLVKQALRELLPNATRLVITHRLSTIRSASSILVLNKGSLVQQGDHNSLLATDGLYKRLVETQEFID
ncbi:MAG: hypothetical protein DCC75_13200, partial [Proteobacteria bacterium]